MNTAIKIESLSKEYRLGVIGHGTLYRDMQSFIAKLNGKEDPNSLLDSHSEKNIKEKILALDNINLEVKTGEIIGIIGKNGSGKSTLLKILSRITSPSKGKISLNGRVASLLEVGTGFHSELTGRENIFLNGALNGLSRIEVSKKIDEIIDFSGVEKFIDTPVKRYSSGMFVRLGFAVAAYLDPDILVVDEVLAVGDYEFQKKCLNKLSEAKSLRGRTILFVSHNLNSVKQICTKTILLDKGKKIFEGDTKEAISKYVKETFDHKAIRNFESKDHQKAYLNSIKIKNEKNELKNNFTVRDSIFVEIEYTVKEHLDKLDLHFSISTENDEFLLFSYDDLYKSSEERNKKPGKYSSTCHIPKDFLNTGCYSFTVKLLDAVNVYNKDQVFKITINDSDDPEGARGYWEATKWPEAAIRPKLKWSNKYSY